MYPQILISHNLGKSHQNLKKNSGIHIDHTRSKIYKNEGFLKPSLFQICQICVSLTENGSLKLRWWRLKHFQTMDKNATFLWKLTVDEFIKICSEYIKDVFLNKIVFAGEYAILMDESTNKAGRAQLAIFVCYADFIIHEPKEEFVFIRKLSTTKTSETVMTKLQSIFLEKGIGETKTCFLGLDGTNAMSGKRKSLQRHIRHVWPFAVTWIVLTTVSHYVQDIFWKRIVNYNH